MAYSVYCYFDSTADDYSSYIDRTTISTIANGSIVMHHGYYQDSQYVIHDVESDTEFLATPFEYGEFYCWAYHIGSSTNTTQYSFDNPFRYTGTENIYIRALGKPSSGEPEEPIVEYWDWDASNGSANKYETSDAHDAILYNGETRNFSYKVWNDMVNKVHDILEYTSTLWNSRYASYSDTLMTPGDTNLTAERFNSLRYNIGIWYSTGINEVSPGDDVLGSYFTTLASCINDWIDIL